MVEALEVIQIQLIVKKKAYRDHVPRLKVHGCNKPIDLHPQYIHPAIINNATSITRIGIVIPVCDVGDLQTA